MDLTRNNRVFYESHEVLLYEALDRTANYNKEKICFNSLISNFYLYYFASFIIYALESSLIAKGHIYE